MKKQILIIFLFFPFLSFSQDAFNETKILVNYESLLQRNDLGELLNIYLEKTDFDSIDYEDFKQVLLFIELILLTKKH